MRSHWASLWLGLLLHSLGVLAQNSTSDTAAAATDAVVGWRANPAGRGTLSLLYSCLLTIFACTWTVLHLNVPGLHDGTWTKLARKVKWMFITVLLPEFIFSKAVCELRLALKSLSEFTTTIHDERDFQTTLSYGQQHIVQVWKWQVEYGCIVGLLYHLMRLRLPLEHECIMCRLYRLMGLTQPPEPPAEEEGGVETTIEGGEEPKTSADGSLTASYPRPGSSEESVGLPDDEESNSDRAGTGAAEQTPAENEGIPVVAECSGAMVIQLREEKASQRERLREDKPIEAMEGVEKEKKTVGCAEKKTREEEAGEREPVQANRSNKRGSEDDDNLLHDVVSLPRPRRRTSGSAQTETIHKYTVPQYWTLVHAYLADMGGLLHASSPTDRCLDLKTEYYALTGAKLSKSYHWNDGHPLRGLILSKDDIDDKSKADWLLKIIAAVQIVWLILTVAARGMLSLPLTQLEIATMAFSIFAVATYAANFWKPKDISKPILLSSQSNGSGARNENFDGTQSFVSRLMQPAKTRQRAMWIRDTSRVKNDMIWMPAENGDVPLVFYIMAASAFVFGGVHCLAWNFEFPSRAELILWRTTSIASAVIPVVSLLASVLLNHLATRHADKLLTKSLVAQIEPVLKFPLSYLELLAPPVFDSWSWESKMATLLPSPGSTRNFDETPTKEAVERAIQEMKRAGSYEHFHQMRLNLDGFTFFLGRFWRAWAGAESSVWDPVWLTTLGTFYDLMKNNFPQEVRSVWNDYEELYARKRCGVPEHELPPVKCVSQFMDALEGFPAEKERIERYRHTCENVSQFVAIFGGILYVTARLVILVLIFTTLRAVPLGVYESTPWTRFLPSFS